MWKAWQEIMKAFGLDQMIYHITGECPQHWGIKIMLKHSTILSSKIKFTNNEYYFLGPNLSFHFSLLLACLFVFTLDLTVEPGLACNWFCSIGQGSTVRSDVKTSVHQVRYGRAHLQSRHLGVVVCMDRKIVGVPCCTWPDVRWFSHPLVDVFH